MKKKKTFFVSNDITSFFEGLDISINLSLIPFISIYFLDHIESRLALIISTSIIISSYFFKPFIYFFINSLIKKSKFIFLYLLPLSYFIPTILDEKFVLLSLFFLLINRISVSYNLTLMSLIESTSFENNKNKNLKFWFLFIIGSLVGVLLIYILNESFSNRSMNEWAWKIGFYILLFFSIINNKVNIHRYDSMDFQTSIISYNFLNIKNLFKDINLILPVTLILLFCVGTWLSNNVTAENRLISEIKFINILFMFIVVIFLHFLFKLLIKSSFYKPFLLTFSLFFLCIGLLGSFNSSSSVDISNFFLTLVSCLCITFFGLGLLKDKKNINSKYHINLSSPLFIVSLIFPLYLYFLMFSIININLIFIILFIIFIFNFAVNSIIIKKI